MAKNKKLNKRKNKKYQKNKRYEPYVVNSKGEHIFYVPQYLSIYNPKDYKITMRFINSLDLILEKDLKEVTIDFSFCNKLKAAATVILYARLDSILERQKNIKINIKSKIKSKYFVDKIYILLKQNGIIDLCQRKKQSKDIFNRPILPVISGVSRQFIDDIIDFIKEQIYGNKLTGEQEHIYSDAVFEAINNVTVHAYPDISRDKCQWWLKCDVADNQLFLVLYDQGAGIPDTFKKGNDLFDNIDWQSDEVKDILKSQKELFNIDEDKELELSSLENESSIISLAMAPDLTRITGDDEKKHGQGSKSIKKLVSINDNGILWVFSNSGLYKYRDENTLPQLVDAQQSINGTLIQWNIRIDYD